MWSLLFLGIWGASKVKALTLVVAGNGEPSEKDLIDVRARIDYSTGWEGAP